MHLCPRRDALIGMSDAHGSLLLRLPANLVARSPERVGLYRPALLFMNRGKTEQILLVATEREQGEAGRLGRVGVRDRDVYESLPDDERHDDDEQADAQRRR